MMPTLGHPNQVRFAARTVWKPITTEQLAKMAEGGDKAAERAQKLMAEKPEWQKSKLVVRTTVEGNAVPYISEKQTREVLAKKAKEGNNNARIAIVIQDSGIRGAYVDDHTIERLKDRADNGIVRDQLELGTMLVESAMPRGLRGKQIEWFGSPLKPAEVTQDLLDGYAYLATVAQDKNYDKYEGTAWRELHLDPARDWVEKLDRMIPPEQLTEAKKQANAAIEKDGNRGFDIEIDMITPTLELDGNRIGQFRGIYSERLLLKPVPTKVEVPDTPADKPGSVHTQEFFRNPELVQQLEGWLKEARKDKAAFIGFRPRNVLLGAKPKLFTGGEVPVRKIIGFIPKNKLTPKQQNLLEWYTDTKNQGLFGTDEAGNVIGCKGYSKYNSVYDARIMVDVRGKGTLLYGKKLGDAGFDPALEFLRPDKATYKTLNKLDRGLRKGDKSVMKKLKLTQTYAITEEAAIRLLNAKPGWISPPLYKEDRAIHFYDQQGDTTTPEPAKAETPKADPLPTDSAHGVETKPATPVVTPPVVAEAALPAKAPEQATGDTAAK